MRKIFIGLAMLSGMLVSAQYFGAKAGINFANIKPDGGSSKMGFQAGIFYNLPILRTKLSVQPEMYYSLMGFSTDKAVITRNTKTMATSVDTKFSLINVATMLHYDVKPSWYLETGVDLSNVWGVKSTSPHGEMAPWANKNAINTGRLEKKMVHNVSFGLAIGGGYYFTKNFGVSLRQIFGLTDFSVFSPSNDKITNTQLSVIYRLK